MSFEFSKQLRAEALNWLGYTPDELFPAVPVFRNQDDLDIATAQLSDLLVRLESVRQAVEQAMPDTMAVKVGDLEVNYMQHWVLLQRHGQRLTQQLSRFLSVPIVHSQFQGSSPISRRLG